jgi:hypothetical protein
MSRGEPNTHLRVLLAEAGWTGEAMARAVNAVGAEAGLRLRYDRTAVAHWLAGVRPNRTVQQVVAEAFARRLGRPVGLAAVGFAGDGGGSPEHGDVLVELIDLCRSDADPARRMALRDSLYTVSALALPEWRDLRADPGAEASGPPAGRLAEAQIEAMKVVGRFFAEGYSAYGGGHARAALAAYLANDVAAMLRVPARPRLRSLLLSATAQLAYLAGFMAYDEQLHGTAQRYYLAAVHLAARADDEVTYAVGLAGLSAQAGSLGHARLALRLAETAFETPAPTAIRAGLAGRVAVALACIGQDDRARQRLGTAETLLERADEETGFVGRYHRADFDYQTAQVLAAARDRPGAIKALQTSLLHRPLAERRSRVITLARLAELQLDEGHLEAACATWNRFLDEGALLRSARVERAVARLRSRLRPYRRHPAVPALLWRAGVGGIGGAGRPAAGKSA